MKLLFLSDLHLGSPLFESEAEIINLLSKDYDQIYIIGDLLDVWEDDLASVVSDNMSIINRIHTLDNVIIIKGNHDPSLVELEGVFPKKNVYYQHELGIGDKKCIVAHGDEFDDLIRKYSWLAKFSWPINWLFERVGINLKGFFRKLFYSVSAKRKKKYYNDLVLNMEEKFVDCYKDEYDYMIVGHTHFPKITKGNDFTYINSGDWIHNKSYVEFVDGEFKLTEL